MAFVPTASTVTFEARYSLNGALIENCLAFYIGAIPFATAAPQICTAYEQQVWLVLRDFSTADTIYREGYVTDQSSAEGPTYTQAATVATASGTVLTDSVPNNAALVISLRSQSRGRSGRGRNYIGGLAEGLKVNSIWQPAPIAALLAAYENMRAVLQTSSITNVVLSKVSNGVPRTAGATYVITDYVNTTPAVRSQRRRNVGVGT